MKPLAWMPAEGKPDDDVACPDARAVDQVAAVDEADAGAGEVQLLVLVDPRQLRSLAAEDRAPGGAAHLGRALDELGDLVEVDAVGRDVVEQEEGLRAGRQHVVDAVRGEVGAAPAEPPRASREDELRADAVGRGRKEPLPVELEEAGEAAEPAGGPGRGRRRDGLPEPLHHALGGGERHPCGRIGPLVAHGNESRPSVGLCPLR